LLIHCLTAFPQEMARDTAALIKQIEAARIPEKVILLNDLADAFLPGNPRKAMEYAEQAETIAAQNDRPAELSRAYHSIADALFYLDDMDKSAAYYLKSSEIEKELHGDRSDEYAARLGEVANCYDLMDYHEVALSYYQQTLDIATENNNRPEMAANLANIGRIQTLRGNYGDAIDLLQQALKLDEEAGEDEVIATDLNTIGRIYQAWGRDDDALDYFQRSMALDENAGRSAKVAIRLNNMGMVFLDNEEYEKALQVFQKAMQIDMQEGNEERTGVRLSNLGTTYSAMGEYRKAIQYLRKAEEIFLRHSALTDMAGVYYQLGVTLQKSGDFSSAERYLLQSRRLAEDNLFQPQLMQSLHALSHLYEESGRFRDALDYQTQYESLKETVFSKESDRRLSEFRVMYETERERQKAQLLSLDIEIRKKHQSLTLAIGASLVMLLLLIIVFLRLLALSHKRKKELAEQKAKALNEELDMRNRELTMNAMSIVRANESLSGMVDSLEKAMGSGESQQQLQAILRTARNIEHQKGWEEFETRFTLVHQEFYRKLEEQFPGLTPNERKLCAFLRLNMTSKDIASITHQSLHSIEVARTRLRKKLNLTGSDANLVAFLAKL
jgi:tetratricopeptide (TPR) repeat protein/DNA-binding CsgD family transcriptional regulator